MIKMESMVHGLEKLAILVKLLLKMVKIMVVACQSAYSQSIMMSSNHFIIIQSVIGMTNCVYPEKMVV